jgi:cytidylate kinase
VLRGKAKCLNVFVYADDSARIKRVMEVYGDAPNEKKAQKLIRDTDRLRSRHYRYYTDNEWGKSSEYDICVNSATIGIEKCVDMLANVYVAIDAE